MHELSLVRELLEALSRKASVSGAARITRVHLEMNPLSGFDADDVEFSFCLVKRESPVTMDAELTLEVLEGRVRCHNCGYEFIVDEMPAYCAKCESMQLVPVHPTGLILKGYEME